MDGNSKGGEDFQRESSKRTSSSSNSITSLPQDAQEETGSTTSHETFSSLQNLDKAIDSSVQANALENKDDSDFNADDALKRLNNLHREHKRYKVPRHPLDLNWAFGFNVHRPCTHSLETGFTSEIFFSSGHSGILYNHDSNDQFVLQGHRHEITASCLSSTKQWLATGDVGDDATLIIWDLHTRLPIRTYFQSEIDHGIQACCFSEDASTLCVITLQSDGICSQKFKVFDWTNGNATSALQVLTINGTTSSVCHLTIHAFSPETVLANTSNEALFVHWETDQKPSIHVVHAGTSHILTASSFLLGDVVDADDDRAISSTRNGEVLVWSRPKSASINAYKHLKTINVCDCAINTIALTPDHRFVFLGCADGCIRCYDNTCRALGWNDDLESGAITSISFAHDPTLITTKPTTEPSVENFSQAVPNFIASTFDGLIIQVITGKEFSQKVLLHSHIDGITDVAVHPSDAIVASIAQNGNIQLWRYSQGEHLLTKNISSDVPTALCYSSDGNTLAVGFDTGLVEFRDALSLELITEHTTIPSSQSPVIQLAFSSTNEYAAAAFGDSAVGLYKFDTSDPDKPWLLIGRNRAHVGGVTHILFETSKDSSNENHLYSIGKDCMMVEYDLTSTFDTQLQIKEPRVRLNNGSYPLAVADYETEYSEPFRVTANSDFKFKLYNKSTNMCRQTLLGPMYGDPVKFLTRIPKHPDHLKHQLLAFANTDKVGLALAPLDGNPHKYLAMLAHPSEVSALRVAHDGRYLFTASSSGESIHMWQINPTVLAALVATSPQGMDALYELVEGGREGEIVQDLKEYFYYSQLRRHGLTSLAPLEASDTLPLEDITDVLRAVGFFPTEHQIVEIMNEVKFKDYMETGKYKTSVSLDDIVTLFVNHRPALGIAPEDIEKAFKALAPETGGSISSGQLYELLQQCGDKMTEDELARCLTSLLGTSQLDGALPRHINADVFAEDIVGFEL
eukprot:gene3037-5819_t